MAARSISSMCEGRALPAVSRGPVLLPRWRPSGCQFDPRGLAQLCCNRHEHVQAEFIRLAARQVGHPALAAAAPLETRRASGWERLCPYVDIQVVGVSINKNK